MENKKPYSNSRPSNRGSYPSRAPEKNGVSRERFEQQRRESAEATEARKLAREAAQEKAADLWHQQNIVAYRPKKTFVSVMMRKTVTEVVKDHEGRLKDMKKVVSHVEEVLAENDTEALMLAMRREPSFQKAFVVTAAQK